jgi:hypothetical protein
MLTQILEVIYLAVDPIIDSDSSILIATAVPDMDLLSLKYI